MICWTDDQPDMEWIAPSSSAPAIDITRDDIILFNVTFEEGAEGKIVDEQDEFLRKWTAWKVDDYSRQHRHKRSRKT